VLFGIERAGRSAGHLGAPRADVEDKVAPDFALQSINGKTVRLSDFRGKAVLLNFLGNLLRALQDRDAVVCRAAG
jgi:hypothetical protein